MIKWDTNEQLATRAEILDAMLGSVISYVYPRL